MKPAFSSSSSPGEKLPFGDSLPLSAEDELPAESPVLAYPGNEHIRCTRAALLGTGVGFDDIEFESGVDTVDPIGDEAGILASSSVSL